MIFKASNTIHKNLSSLDINNYKCNVSAITNIRKLSYDFFYSLNDEKFEIFWYKIMKIIRKFEFNTQIYPLTSNHELLMSKKLLSELEISVGFVQKSHQSYYNSYLKLINTISQFVESNNNTYENCFKSIIKELVKNENYNIVCVLYRLSKINEIEDYFGNDDDVRDLIQYVEFGSFSSIKNKLFDAVIIVGPNTIYPDSLINSPRANKIYNLSYNWNKSEFKPKKGYSKSLYNEPSINHKAFQIGKEVIHSLDNNICNDLFDEISLNVNSIKNKIRSGNYGTDFIVKVRTIFLENGKYIFLDEHKNKYVVNSGLHISGIREIDEILVHLCPKEMSNGMFLTYRDSSSSDYIEAYADHLMGVNANEHRTLLLKWKNILKEKAKNNSTIEMALDIIDCGGDNTVKEINVRNWMSNEIIAPDNIENLLAILKYCDLEDEAENLVKNALYIRKIHKKAGQQIRHELTKTLKKINFDDLEKAGTLFIGSDIIRNLIISRITDISEVLQIPSRMLNKPFDIN